MTAMVLSADTIARVPKLQQEYLYLLPSSRCDSCDS